LPGVSRQMVTYTRFSRLTGAPSGGLQHDAANGPAFFVTVCGSGPFSGRSIQSHPCDPLMGSMASLGRSGSSCWRRRSSTSAKYLSGAPGFERDPCNAPCASRRSMTQASRRRQALRLLFHLGADRRRVEPPVRLESRTTTRPSDSVRVSRLLWASAENGSGGRHPAQMRHKAARVTSWSFIFIHEH